MSHKKSNEELRGERLVSELASARDSAAWQAERERQAAWTKPEPRRDEPGLSPEPPLSR